MIATMISSGTPKRARFGQSRKLLLPEDSAQSYPLRFDIACAIGGPGADARIAWRQDRLDHRGYRFRPGEAARQGPAVEAVLLMHFVDEGLHLGVFGKAGEMLRGHCRRGGNAEDQRADADQGHGLRRLMSVFSSCSFRGLGTGP